MPVRRFRIGRSTTGLGLFATKPIPAKAYIVTYSGQRIPSRQAQYGERHRGAKYMFEINSRWTIDGSSRRNLGRYANHSCRPNAEAVLRGGKVAIEALRDIAPGEEITYDYGKEYFDLFIKPKGCRCAACARRRQRRRAS
jgi:SET domain-containing protein